MVIHYPNEKQWSVIFTARNSHSLLHKENFLQTMEWLFSNFIQSKPKWQPDKHRIPLPHLQFNLIQENISISAHQHIQSTDRHTPITPLQSIQDSLWTIPFTDLLTNLYTFLANFVNPERCLRIIQKQFKFLFASVPIDSFMQKHLAGSDHATPASIGCSLRSLKRLKVLTVGEPSCVSILLLYFSDKFLVIVGHVWELLPKNDDFRIY